MRQIAAALLAALIALPAFAAEGLTVKSSPYGVEETIDRLEAAVRDRGLTVFTRIDHRRGAEGAGLELAPTLLLVFGNPKAGTPLMQEARTIAIDLPMKALAWEDGEGTVWLAYNEPRYLAQRHDLTGQPALLGRMSRLLDAVTDAATRPQAP